MDAVAVSISYAGMLKKKSLAHPKYFSAIVCFKAFALKKKKTSYITSNLVILTFIKYLAAAHEKSLFPKFFLLNTLIHTGLSLITFSIYTLEWNDSEEAVYCLG